MFLDMLFYFESEGDTLKVGSQSEIFIHVKFDEVSYSKDSIDHSRSILDVLISYSSPESHDTNVSFNLSISNSRNYVPLNPDFDDHSIPSPESKVFVEHEDSFHLETK